MAPTRPKNRGSSPLADNKTTMVPISTPTQRSPIKQRKMGISAQQKQALVDNLQLEITERARRLRAQYHLQAQGLRSRIEIRVNRIPMSLRKYTMEDLLLKYTEKEQRGTTAMRPPPVPSKDGPPRAAQRSTQTAQKTGRALKRTSGDFNGDKENEMENLENPKKKPRGAPTAGTGAVRPGQVLSPTSSNSRLMNGRPVSPAKSQIARPGSPLKATGSRSAAAATSMLSSFVEKAKSTRSGGTRKVTTTSNTSSSSSGAPAPPKTTRRGAPASATKPPTSRPGTRMARRLSANSETSEGSNTTVVRKGPAPKTAPPSAKKTATGGYAKPTASGNAKKTPAAKSNAAPTTRTGRVLRNRG